METGTRIAVTNDMYVRWDGEHGTVEPCPAQFANYDRPDVIWVFLDCQAAEYAAHPQYARPLPVSLCLDEFEVVAGPRGDIYELAAADEHHGSSRSWGREIHGKRYSFTAVLMPSGERRYAVSRLKDGGDGRFGCDWKRVAFWTIPAPARSAPQGYLSGHTQTWGA